VTVLEGARISVDPDKAAEFEAAFARAVRHVRAAEGHLDSRLMRDVDSPGSYLFLVQWQRLADHVETFVHSEGFRSFGELVAPYFASDPDVSHYETVEATA